MTTPIVRESSLEQVAFVMPPSGVSNDDFDTVHNCIEQELSPLDASLEQHVPGVAITSGKTTGKGFLLFSYHAYSLAGNGAPESIVVGITFTSGTGGIPIDADASGEESGKMIVSLKRETVPARGEEVRRAAMRRAKELVAAKEQIAAALAAKRP